ncbi:MAG: hypothetical protein DRQ88_01835 [Epsilonproteobacteria bacterium]|nr:MAG: hypothetical protein DRQ89_08630 [Campylobacterota bacterium]RLA67817.1 MAG: hypothetical protein DRQ88_01835 [Campylobacterota bacterium]
MKIILALSLLFISLSTQANIKKNRYKYADYVGSRYNSLLKIQRLLGDIVLYTTGHKSKSRYFPKQHPFPKREAVKGGNVQNRHFKFTVALGNKLEAIRNVMNSPLKKWTATHYQNLKALVGEANQVWTRFGSDMSKTFPQGSVMRGEPPITSYFRTLKAWKIKSIRELDRED